jgi:hypothetical protein
LQVLFLLFVHDHVRVDEEDEDSVFSFFPESNCGLIEYSKHAEHSLCGPSRCYSVASRDLIPRPAHDRASPGMANKSIDDIAVNDMGDKKGNSLYTLPDSKRLLRDRAE